MENNESCICNVMTSELDKFMPKESNAFLFSLRTLVRKSVAKSNCITCLCLSFQAASHEQIKSDIRKANLQRLGQNPSISTETWANKSDLPCD